MHRTIWTWARLSLLIGLLPALEPARLPAQATTAAVPSPRDQLLAADRAASDSAASIGLTNSITGFMADDAVLVYSGAPVLSGLSSIREFLSVQPALGALRWQPLTVELSAGEDFGVIYGVATLAAKGPDGATDLRLGKYLAAWRRTEGVWRLVGAAFLGVIRPPEAVLPASLRPLEYPAVSTEGVGGRLAAADLAFARLAGQRGAAEAFYAFAAPDAATFSGGGPLNRGPAQIREALKEAPGESSSWSWYPVVAAASAAGDLGFTVGQAVIRGKSTDGTESTFYSKYLTLWRRENDGSYRFISDGGNARPAPLAAK